MLIAICNVLTTCGFTVPHNWDYITTNEGLDSWDAFTMIDFDDFGDIAKLVLRRPIDQFTISAVKIKALKALKFWIEDKARMNEPMNAVLFTCPILSEYVRLHAITSVAQKDNVEFVV